MDLQTKLVKFITLASARDKVARIVQYSCRALHGILLQTTQTSLAERVINLSKALSIFRSVMRFGVPVSLAITIMRRHAERNPNWLTTIKDLGCFFYFVFDNILYFEKVGVSRWGTNSSFY